FHLGMRWRSRRGLGNHPLAPKPIRRTLAGFQMGYVAVVLWPPFSPSITVIAGIGFMLPLLVGFLVDWCVVSGRIDVGQANVQRRFATLERLSFLWLQPLLRAVCVAAVLFLIGTQPTGAWWLTIALPSVLALLLGIGSRIAALAL